MTATIHHLPNAAGAPVLQRNARDARLVKMAEIIARRSEGKGFACTVEEGLAAVRSSLATLDREGRGLIMRSVS